MCPVCIARAQMIARTMGFELPLGPVEQRRTTQEIAADLANARDLYAAMHPDEQEDVRRAFELDLAHAIADARPIRQAIAQPLLPTMTVTEGSRARLVELERTITFIRARIAIFESIRPTIVEH
jgi:hypothetical protein